MDLKSVKFQSTSDTAEALELNDITEGDPVWPTPKRRRKIQRGLPTDENLRKLAATWLDHQSAAWPTLRGSDLLPEKTEAVLDRMVAEYKARFSSGVVTAIEYVPRSPWNQLGAGYLRYSADTSNPRSLDDQLVNVLRRAHGDKRFIPWAYVCADSSVSGTLAIRQGYALAKLVMQLDGCTSAGVLYVDDYGRASRDILESYRLARQLQGVRKGMIGASDGFDLNNPMAETTLAATAMVNSMFITQLRAKVKRGLQGAARRRTLTGKVALGYRAVPVLDAQGKPTINHKEKVVKTREVFEEEARIVRRAFEMFGVDNRSYSEVAAYLNANKVRNSQAWDTPGVKQIFNRLDYIGIRITGRYSDMVDAETGQVSKMENPREEWVVDHWTELRIVSDNLWKRVCKRMRQVARDCPTTGRRYTHNQLHASTLFSGTLFCGCCGKELLLERSVGDYKQMGCRNGCKRLHGCTHKGSKSVRIIEACLLNYIHHELLGPESMERLVEAANAHLAEEARRPKVDTSALKHTIAEKRARIEELMTAITGRNQQYLNSILTTIEGLERELGKLQIELRQIEAQNAEVPPPIQMQDVERSVADLRGLLNQNVKAAAPILRALIGDVMIEHKPTDNPRRPLWVAHINNANPIPLLARVAKEGDYPDAVFWEYLNHRNWIVPSPAQVDIHKVPRYQQIAAEVVRELDNGANKKQLAARLGVDTLTVNAAWRYGKHGVADANYKPDLKPYNPPIRESAPERLADEVARLRHDEHMSIDAIAERFSVERTTIERAHVHWHQQHPDQPGDIPWKLLCGRGGRFTVDQRQQIIQLHQQGLNGRQVAEKLDLPLWPVKNQLQTYRRHCRQHDN